MQPITYQFQDFRRGVNRRGMSQRRQSVEIAHDDNIMPAPMSWPYMTFEEPNVAMDNFVQSYGQNPDIQTTVEFTYPVSSIEV